MTIGQFLKILRARMRLILMFMLTACVAAIVVTMILPKRYEATASVMVDTKAADSALSSGSAPPTMENNVANVVSTNLDIIGSPNVALKVVEMLRLEQNPRARELLVGSSPLGELREWVYGWISRLLPQEEGKEASVRDWMADRLLRNLRLNSNRDSRLIKVSYSSPDPGFSAAAANAFVQSYRDTLLQLRVQPAQQSTKWFDEQVSDLKRNLEQAEAKLSKFQQEKGIVATDEKLDLENAQLSDLSAQLATAQTQSYESAAKQRQFQEFLTKGGSAATAPVEVLSSPSVQQLKQQAAQDEAKLGELSRRVGKNHPQYLAAAAQLQRTRSALRQEMRNVAQGLSSSSGVSQQREVALRSALQQQRNRVLKLKGDRNELAMLARDAENAQRAYNEAVQRSSQTRLESKADQTGGSIIDSAVAPTKPASPNVVLNLAVALAAGLVLGIGVALFCETVNRYVRSEQDIVEILGIPVLAVLSAKVSARQNVRQLKGPGVYSLPRP